MLVNFHDVSGYCRFVGRRLPTVDEWKSTCEAGKLKKRGDIWEWTSTDVDIGGANLQSLVQSSEFMRLLASLLAAVEEPSERLSLRPGSDAGDLVARVVSRGSSLVDKV